MLNSLARRIAVFLLHQNCFEENLLPVYIYGVELFLSSLLGVSLVLTAGLLAGSFQSSVIFLVSFIFLRLFTGGLHCNTYLACNCVMIITFLAVLTADKFISSLTYNSSVYCIMMVLSLTVTIILAPVSNPNKEVTPTQKRRCQLISVGLLLLHFIIHIIFQSYISTEIIVITDFVSSAYIIIGLLKNKTERRMSDENQKEHS